MAAYSASTPLTLPPPSHNSTILSLSTTLSLRTPNRHTPYIVASSLRQASPPTYSPAPESTHRSSFNKFLDSCFVACTSLALSVSVFITDVDTAAAFVVATPRKLQTDELATVRLFQENTPSVVYITNLASRQDAFTLDVLEVPQGSGSGFVWDKKGHVVTNYRVIQGAYDLRPLMMQKLLGLTKIRM